MSTVMVTGSSGLIGSESVRFFHEKGFQVIGIDNNMREQFFGPKGSIHANTQRLVSECPNFQHVDLDIRNEEKIFQLFRTHGRSITGIIHTASQPSHDWSARDPLTDFSINASGTLILLEALRKYCPEAVFIFTSTNKVYGDLSNTLPFVELETRWELAKDHPFHLHGFNEAFSIDQSKHSPFGASKAAADLMVQEYGRYFGLKTGVFRCGCLTGPAHAGVELHGFLSYLVYCAMTERPYNIYGYKGKQVRDNIHSYDLVNAFWHFYKNPRKGAVYNMGGSRHSNCSILEAIQLVEANAKCRMNVTRTDEARSGDHIWWISDVRKFQADYPDWRYAYDLPSILREMIPNAVKGGSIPHS